MPNAAFTFEEHAVYDYTGADARAESYEHDVLTALSGSETRFSESRNVSVVAYAGGNVYVFTEFFYDGNFLEIDVVGVGYHALCGIYRAGDTHTHGGDFGNIHACGSGEILTKFGYVLNYLGILPFGFGVYGFFSVEFAVFVGQSAFYRHSSDIDAYVIHTSSVNFIVYIKIACGIDRPLKAR